MLRLGAHINDRDYKRRTPLFVAAETGKNLLEWNIIILIVIWDKNNHLNDLKWHSFKVLRGL